MADYDSVSTCKSVVSILPAVLAADNTEITVDTLNWRSAMVEMIVGIGGITFDATNKVEFKLTHSDDDTTYTAVEADDVILPFGETLGTGGIIRSLVAEKAAADTAAVQVGYVGKKRYLQLLADFSGTHGAGTPIAANIVLGHPLHAPGDQGNYDDSHSESF
ncbi:MAG: hypothetical protein RIC14_05630 [Filomicrobium sp.]